MRLCAEKEKVYNL